MDPVELVVTALVAGATKGAEGLAESSLKEAYGELKGLLKKFFAGRQAAEVVLEEHESDPEIYRAPLEKILRDSLVTQQSQIRDAAQNVLRIVDPEGSKAGHYVVGTIAADRGGVAAAHIAGNVEAGYRPAPEAEHRPL